MIVAEKRKKNSKKAALIDPKIQKRKRKRIETSISSIVDTFPRTIRAITQQGFELKLTLFIVVFSIFTS